MHYKNTLDFAVNLDQHDPLKSFQSKFYAPQHNGGNAIYFCGNSLGLQPVAARQYLDDQLENWKSLAIEGFFQGGDPWLHYHDRFTQSIASIVGADADEVTIMNSLTVNLHLMLVSFYKPTKSKYKIIMEGGAFPSDQYALASQVVFHGYNPDETIIEIHPREGESILRTDDILKVIKDNSEELALVLFGGINYYTGQFYDLQAITMAAHRAGAYAGFDLAHAAGNVILKLDEWDVDFACWCSYKYMNSGPGGISGVFINRRHFNDQPINRLSGWWGYRQDKRFLMKREFVPEQGASGWQLSTSPVMLLALHKASLDIFDEAGGMEPLREKGDLLTGYLEFLIHQINSNANTELFRIITPGNAHDRGSQLSVVCLQNARETFNYLTKHGVIGDWREPDLIRLAPVPLYNSFQQVFEAGRILAASVGF